ncbi:MAG: class I SAM-dependent methyltransferase [Caldimonas sp.]
MKPSSLPPSYFDRIYAADPDPWSFASSEYERSKYAATLDALPRAAYERAFEIGCSIGILTEQLAARCRHLLAVDVSQAALDQARDRCAALLQVELRLMEVPNELPSGEFDLILVSEVGYYWVLADLRRALDWMCGALRSGGDLVLVHWTPVVSDYPLAGDDVHELAHERAVAHGLRHVAGQRYPQYRIDVFEAD